MAQYTITEVSGPREWSGTYGKNHDYTLRLEGVERQVEYTIKPDKPAPQAGEQISLILEPHPRFEGKWKGKREQTGGFGGPKGSDAKSIEAQVCIKSAVEIAVAVGGTDAEAMTKNAVAAARHLHKTLRELAA